MWSANDSFTLCFLIYGSCFSNDETDSPILQLLEFRTDCHISFERFPLRALSSRSIAQALMNQTILHMNFRRLPWNHYFTWCLFRIKAARILSCICLYVASSWLLRQPEGSEKFCIDFTICGVSGGDSWYSSKAVRNAWSTTSSNMLCWFLLCALFSHIATGPKAIAPGNETRKKRKQV